MKVGISGPGTQNPKADLLAFNIFEGTFKPAGELAAADRALKGVISSLISSKEITGKKNTNVVLHTHGRLRAKYVLVVGCGKRDEFDLESVRLFASETVKQAKKARAASVAAFFHAGDVSGSSPLDVFRSFAEAAFVREYEFPGYKTGKNKEDVFRISEMTMVQSDPSYIGPCKKALAVAAVCAEAVNKTRDLVNTPSNMLTPRIFSLKAKEVCARNKLSIKVLDAPAIKKMGMGGIWGVGKGSDNPPAVIVIWHKGGSSSSGTTALIGKGVTFDSGGISIKPSKKMGDMKEDMAGAAAVLYSMEAISKLKIKKNILAVIPLVENMPSGKALKPGDVIKTMSGTTVEIISTDAEGRLILADAITYAKKMGASKLVDFATLTGACTTSLGDIAAAALGNDGELVESVINAGGRSGERLWELPLYDEYGEYLKSSVADIKNCSDLGKASTSTAAFFLKDFVGDTPWVHVDIASIASLEREVRFWGKGATGAGVFTAVNYLLFS